MKEIRSEKTWILYFLFFQSLLYNIASFSSARILTSLVTIVFIQEEDAFTIHIVKLVLETLLIISTKSFLGLSAHDSSHALELISKPAQFLSPSLFTMVIKQKWIQDYRMIDKIILYFYETLGAWRVVIIWCTYNQNSQNAILKTLKFFKVMVI